MQKYSNNKKVLCFGEVLWDILPEGKRIGGAPLNVAYHLHKLGTDVVLASRIGEDTLGKDIQKFIEENRLAGSLLQTDPDHPTSTVQAKIGTDQEVSYQILENVAWDFIEYDTALKNLTKQVDYMVYGSLITRSEVSRNTLYKLLESPLIKVLDVNLRIPFYSKEILEKLLTRADIVKMNEAELQILSEWFSLAGDDQEKMKSLSKAFGLKALITTCGPKGACLWQDNHIFFEPGYQIKIADTVGSGDAFLAGFLSEYIVSRSPPKALKAANIMGAFIAQKSGGCPHYEKVKIQKRLISL